MAEITIVKLSEAIQEERMDAEFFRPIFDTTKSKFEWEPIGSILKTCQYGSSKPLNEEGKGCHVFRLDEIKSGFLTTPKKFVELNDEERASLLLSKDDILFCRTNGTFDMVGRTGILKKDVDAVFASYLIRIRPKEDKILPEYLLTYLNCKYGLAHIRRRAMISIQVNVSATQLKKIPIPIISHSIQKNIASLINTAGNDFANAERKFIEAQEMLLSYFEFKDSELEDELTYVVDLKDVKKEARIDAEFYRLKPKKLKEKIKRYKNGYSTISNIAPISNEKIDPTKKPNEKFIYVELADINEDVAIIDNPNTIYGKDAPSRAKMRLLKEDVIVSSVEGSFGKLALVPEEYQGAVASTGFFIFRPKTNVRCEYLLALIKSPIVQIQLEREVGGTILAAVPKTSIESILIPNIPENKQIEIAELVRESQNSYKNAKKWFNEAIAILEQTIKEDN